MFPANIRSEANLQQQETRFRAFDKAMALAEFGLDGRLLYANENYLALLKIDPQQSQALLHENLCPPASVSSSAHADMWASLCAGKDFSGVVERVCRDGSHCWLEALYAPVRDESGKVIHIVMLASDVTQSRQRELAQQEHLWRLSLVADKTDAAIVITNANSRIVYNNDGFSRMFGWTLEEIANQKLLELLAQQASSDFFHRIRSELQAGRAVEVEEVVTGKEGRRYWVKLICNPVMDESGQWQYTVSVLADITRTKMHEVLNNRVLEAMAYDLPLLQVLEMVCEEVERIAPDVCVSILQIDDQGLLRPLASPSLPSSYSSQLDGLAIGPQTGSCGTAAWRKQSVLVTDIASDPLWADFKHLILPLGYKACWSTPIMEKEGKVVGTFAFYYRDNGSHVASRFHQQLVQACTHLCALALEREHTRLRIRQLAFYDALTGLPNRRLLYSNAEQMLQAMRNKGQRAAVLFINLDRFKHVNDSLGHPAGDELLCVVSERIKEILRHCDGGTAGRLSGDEFVVVLPGNAREHVSVAIERLQAALMQPQHLDGAEVEVSASIGVAMYPQDGCDMETLLYRADMAMHQAKSAGRGRFSFFSSEMNRQAQERLALENALRQALQEGSLHLHYQPQVEVHTGCLYGVEALARWHHPTLGNISPARFIPLAEECDLMQILGRWALKEACRQLGQWRARGLAVPSVAVNLSPSNFHSLDLPDLLAETLEHNALQPSDLMLELTEDILLDTNSSTMKTIEKVHAQGIRLSMDDFGTGYSSLSYLRRLPITELKLDRSFVADLENDEAARALSSAILGICKSLSLTVVAEGVETIGQKETLRAQGYPVLQGYLFSKPLPPEDLEEWLRAGKLTA